MKANYETFDSQITLKKIKAKAKDKYGNTSFEYESLSLLCNIKSVDRNQFYNAGNKNYKLAYIITVNDFEYNDAEKIEVKGKLFDVVRTYNAGDGFLEIVTGEKIGV